MHLQTTRPHPDAPTTSHPHHKSPPPQVTPTTSHPYHKSPPPQVTPTTSHPHHKSPPPQVTPTTSHPHHKSPPPQVTPTTSHPHHKSPLPQVTPTTSHPHHKAPSPQVTLTTSHPHHKSTPPQVNPTTSHPHHKSPSVHLWQCVAVPQSVVCNPHPGRAGCLGSPGDPVQQWTCLGSTANPESRRLGAQMCSRANTGPWAERARSEATLPAPIPLCLVSSGAGMMKVHVHQRNVVL